MAQSSRRGRKVGGSTHSRVIGSLTKRLAAAELAAIREERQRQYEAAVTRWEQSQQAAQLATVK